MQVWASDSFQLLGLLSWVSSGFTRIAYLQGLLGTQTCMICWTSTSIMMPLEFKLKQRVKVRLILKLSLSKNLVILLNAFVLLQYDLCGELLHQPLLNHQFLFPSIPQLCCRFWRSNYLHHVDSSGG